LAKTREVEAKKNKMFARDKEDPQSVLSKVKADINNRAFSLIENQPQIMNIWKEHLDAQSHSKMVKNK
jgi:hypothetical protein